MHFEFRAPGIPLSLEALLGRAFPGMEASAAETLLGKGAVTVGTRSRAGLATRVAPGTLISVDAQWEMALPLSLTPPVRVLVPAMAYADGHFDASKRLKGGLRFERMATRDGLSELRLDGEPLMLGRALEHLARLGFPVVGDLRRGGILATGGLRCRGEAEAEPDDWWPQEPARLGAANESAPPHFAVSRATLRALGRSHPWVIRDDETDDAGRFSPGALVRIGDDLLARVEDGGRVAARIWSRGGASSARVEDRVAKALARRGDLLRPDPSLPFSDCLRLIHGEADGLPGLAVDRLGPLLRVLVSGRAAEAVVSPALDVITNALRDVLGDDPPVVEVTYLRDRPPGHFRCVRLARGSREHWSELVDPSEPDAIIVLERGLRFRVDVGLSRPEKPSPGIGLYLDQRDNRRRLAQAAAHGGRWLNLFAHTGAISVALLDGGADEVTSVDLSARILRWLEANLALNPEVDAWRHHSVVADGRSYFGSGEARPFDGIVIDPPTAAAGGSGYWKLERDLPPLLEAALSRLAPGGTLFVSRNDRRRRERATQMIERAAQRAGVKLTRLDVAPPGRDFPSLEGFPEGDPFDAAIAERK